MADINVSQYQIGENTYHYRDAQSMEALENKVDKITDYSLISNANLTKLDGIEANANHTVVDDELSLVSTNPLANNVVTEEINKLNRYASNQEAGLVKVGNTLGIDSDGVLNIQYVNSITPETIAAPRVPIATFSMNGDTGTIYAPQGGGGSGSVDAIETTKALYDALPIEQKLDDSKIYFITDSTPAGGDGYVIAGQLEGSVLGNQATAEGKDVVSSGEQTHAEGLSTSAIGNYAHAEGIYTSASNTGAHAEGVGTSSLYTVASGIGAHASGKSTTASGDYSCAMGEGTIASYPHQLVIGRYNSTQDLDLYAFVIGNGSDDSNRSNALAIKWDGTIIYPSNS